MQYMIIETFKAGKIKEVYERFDQRGRLIPDGLQYISSWIAEDLTTCYQVMETEQPERLQDWMDKWADLIDFKVVATISSAEVRKRL